jgi:DNA invertase Pin-like site-specific DNA recombinase
MKTAAIYARVSTNGQTTDNQIRELRKVAKRHGWKVAAEYIDHGVSGAKGRDQRPALDKLLKAANRRDYSIIMAWSVDRLGRSLRHLVGFLDEIHAKGVDLYLHQQNIDTSTPSGKAMFQMAGVFAEFERSMIQERVRAGLELAREQGKVLGRPKVPARTESLIRQKRKQDMGILKIAREVGVGTSVVQRVLKAA